MIYLLTAIGLKPGGNSTVHIYTQTIHRTTQTKKYVEQHIIGAKQYIEQHKSLIRKNADRAPSLRCIPWHLPSN
jgi:hypothetical protein